MSTPEDLKPTFSFIGAFQSEAILAPYDHNALPLFAVGLYLGVEDLTSFATESLTDSPDDKKADCDDMFRPTRIGSDPQADWLKCLQNDLSAQSRVGPDGTNCPDEQ